MICRRPGRRQQKQFMENDDEKTSIPLSDLTLYENAPDKEQKGLISEKLLEDDLELETSLDNLPV